MLSWIGNQGVLGATERMLGRTVATPTTFVIVVTVGVLGLLIAAGAYRRSSPVLGLLVVEATESLASPVSWSHHFIWMVLLVAWLALAEDRPRYGEWYALAVVGAPVGGALLVGPARAGGPLRRPGLAHPRSATPTCSSSSCCSSGPRSGWAAPPWSGRSVSVAVPWRRPAPGPRPGAVSGSAAVGLADEDERVGARVEPALGRGLRVRDPPPGHDHELLRVAGTELVAPGLVDGPAQQLGGGPERPRRRAGLGRTPRRWPSGRCPRPPGRAGSRTGTPPPPASGSRAAPRRRTARAQRRRVPPRRARRPGRPSRGRGRAATVPVAARPSASSRRRLSASTAGRSTSNQRTAPPPKRNGRPS